MLKHFGSTTDVKFKGGSRHNNNNNNKMEILFIKTQIITLNSFAVA